MYYNIYIQSSTKGDFDFFVFFFKVLASLRTVRSNVAALTHLQDRVGNR